MMLEHGDHVNLVKYDYNQESIDSAKTRSGCI